MEFALRLLLVNLMWAVRRACDVADAQMDGWTVGIPATHLLALLRRYALPPAREGEGPEEAEARAAVAGIRGGLADLCLAAPRRGAVPAAAVRGCLRAVPARPRLAKSASSPVAMAGTPPVGAPPAVARTVSAPVASEASVSSPGRKRQWQKASADALAEEEAAQSEGLPLKIFIRVKRVAAGFVLGIRRSFGHLRGLSSLLPPPPDQGGEGDAGSPRLGADEEGALAIPVGGLV